MVDQGAAAAAARRDDDLGPVPGQEADRRLVDLGRQHLLGAAGQQRDPHAALALGRENLRPVHRRGRRHRPRRQRHQRAQPPRHQPGKGFCQAGAVERRAQPRRPGQHLAENMAQQPLGKGSAVMLLDMPPAMVDQVHVMHPRRAGRHAAEAGQTPVDMLDGLRADRLGAVAAALFEHVLDQVDAAARAVELIAQQHIGRAGRGAEAAMNTRPQDLFRRRGIRVRKLREREFGLHLLLFQIRHSRCRAALSGICEQVEVNSRPPAAFGEELRIALGMRRLLRPLSASWQGLRDLFHLLDHGPPAIEESHVFVLLAICIVFVETARRIAGAGAFILQGEDAGHRQPWCRRAPACDEH